MKRSLWPPIFRALPIVGIGFASSLGLGSSAGAGPPDYQAWSGHPGPDAEVRFEFGPPHLIVSLKTDDTGIYAPHAFRASDGAIFLGYYTYPDGWSPDPFPAALIRSVDNGVTWRSLGERGNLGYLFGEQADRAVLAVDCSWVRDDKGEPIYTAQSFASGQSSEPVLVKVRVHGFPKGLEPYFHLTRMVRTKNGSLVTVAFTAAAGATHAMWWDPKAPPVPWRIACLASEDEGRNWRLLSYVDPGIRTPGEPPDQSRPCEPFVAALRDGRLLCIYRIQLAHGLGEMLQSWSSDGGATWTAPVSSGVVGVDPCLLQLDDGLLLCAFGRPNVRLMYSLDGGGHWLGHTTIYAYGRKPPPAGKGDPRGERYPDSHAYTSIVALSPDTILYFFDIHQHRVPWTGLLPTDAARIEDRTNSIFAVQIKIIRHEH